MNKLNRVLLVGSGRLAKHLKHWNSLLKVPNQLTQVHHSEISSDLVRRSDYIWLAIKDSALETYFLNQLLPLKSNQTVVHFSGALHFEQMVCAHPLMSFGNELYDHNTYERVHFALTGAKSLIDALPGFENKFNILSAEQKPLYHALCVLAGNFPQMLWSQTQREFKNLGFSEEAAHLYIKQISENFIRYGDQALTGPHIRGDIETIHKNLNALEQNKNLQNIYRTFTENFKREAMK